MSKLIAMTSVIFLSAIVETCQDNALDKIFVNDQAEIFTSENLAALSVGQDKKRYGSVTLSEAKAALAQAKEAEEREKAAGGGTEEGAGDPKPSTEGAASGSVKDTDNDASVNVDTAGPESKAKTATVIGSIKGTEGAVTVELVESGGNPDPGTEGAAGGSTEVASDQTPGTGADTGTKAKKAATKK